MTNLTDEQIRELVPHGVWRAMTASGEMGPWRAAQIKPLSPKYGESLTPSQVAERVLRCETCSGEGGWTVDQHTTEPEPYWDPCPNCSELATLLLKLAGEGDQ